MTLESEVEPEPGKVKIILVYAAVLALGGIYNSAQEVKRIFGEKVLGRTYYDASEEYDGMFVDYRRIE